MSAPVDLLPALELARRGEAGPELLDQLRCLGFVDGDGLPTPAGMRELRRLRRPAGALPPVARRDLDFHLELAHDRRLDDLMLCLDFHSRRCRGSETR